MKKNLLMIGSVAVIAVAMICATVATTADKYIYGDLVCWGTNLLSANENCNARLDIGTGSGKIFSTSDKLFKDEDGKALKFASPAGALNYCAVQGWEFVQAYIVEESSGLKGSQNVYHYLLKKKVSDDGELDPANFILKKK
ncbi:MAG: hypothetical protein LBR66_05530 [Candidatus Symbiothrix sp.]|jgi:hypothetical protein|nr:hypothetical protein [Candidatus Symbiothrix sp.]